MKKRETLFREHVRSFLKTLPNTWFTAVQQIALRGTPDFIICCNGLFLAAELKKNEGAKVHPLQTHNINLIKEANGFACLLYPENFEDFKTLLQDLSSKRFANPIVSALSLSLNQKETQSQTSSSPQPLEPQPTA